MSWFPTADRKPRRGAERSGWRSVPPRRIVAARLSARVLFATRDRARQSPATVSQIVPAARRRSGGRDLSREAEANAAGDLQSHDRQDCRRRGHRGPTSLHLGGPPRLVAFSARRRLEVSRLAHNRALHYLANHGLTDDQRSQLTEVVLGHIGRCDEPQARAGLEWMRERYRNRGETPPF
jgi:hypothetical protein